MTRIANELRVEPGTKANLAGRDTTWTGDAQELLWASDAYAVLVVFQAMDAAGKDSTIEHVMSGVNPQGVQVVSFKQAVQRGARPHVPVADRQGFMKRLDNPDKLWKFSAGDVAVRRRWRRPSSSTPSKDSTCSGRPCRTRTGQPTRRHGASWDAEPE